MESHRIYEMLHISATQFHKIYLTRRHFQVESWNFKYSCLLFMVDTKYKTTKTD